MKYLELFKNGFDSTITEKIKPENWPYVGYSPSEGIVFTVISAKEEPEIDLTIPYVTFTAEEDNSSIGLSISSTNQPLEYSTDTTTWNTFDKTTNISLNNGDKVYIRGMLISDNTMNHISSKFKMSGKIAASGNCNALWNYQDLEAPLKAYCGGRMFEGCVSLTKAPELPATTLSTGCYYNMFRNCTSLISAPELPATTVTVYCYKYMFYGCTSLTVAPELPATELDGGSCYEGMFINCTSLVTAPELPATKLIQDCYNSMFKNCTNLNYIKCLATKLPIGGGTYNWVTAVPSTGTFVKHPDMSKWTTGNNGIPSGWTVVDAEL